MDTLKLYSPQSIAHDRDTIEELRLLAGKVCDDPGAMIGLESIAIRKLCELAKDGLKYRMLTSMVMVALKGEGAKPSAEPGMDFLTSLDEKLKSL